MDWLCSSGHSGHVFSSVDVYLKNRGNFFSATALPVSLKFFAVGIFILRSGISVIPFSSSNVSIQTAFLTGGTGIMWTVWIALCCRKGSKKQLPAHPFFLTGVGNSFLLPVLRFTFSLSSFAYKYSLAVWLLIFLNGYVEIPAICHHIRRV